jgi:DNA repair exonuclease SbcCD ATPase subunit
VSKQPSRNSQKRKAPERKPQVVLKIGERKLANEYAQLQKEREKLQAQIAEIDEKLNELKTARRDELLAELRELGFSPTGSGGSRKTAGPRSTGKRKSSTDGVCPLCGVRGHDGRAHRSQGKNKKAFTKEELQSKGLPTS